MNAITYVPRRRGWFAALLVLSALTAGVLAGLSPATPAILAHGTCQAPNAGCGGDTTKTAVLDVLHIKNDMVTAVEPMTGESWEITAHWNPAFAPCTGSHETASVDVDWNGSGWTLSNISLTTNIIGISVCDISVDCATATGPRSYRLLVDVTDPVPTNLNLQEVSFATTAVDNGVEFDMGMCSVTSNTVTPISQSFTAQDNGTFECAFNCSVTGAAVMIIYQ